MVAMPTPKAIRANPMTGKRPDAASRGFRVAEYISGLPHQPWLWLTAILLVNLLLIAAIAIMDMRFGVDYWNLVRDTNAIAGQPAYYGFYSNIGILLWALAACVALFGSLSLRRLGIRDRRVRALLWGGAFAAVACLDDLFMLHENAGWIGIPEEVVMAGYATFLLAFVAFALPIAHRTKWVFLAGSLGSLALSTIVDQLHVTVLGGVLVEEAFKLTGITLLATYLVTLSYSTLADHCAPQQAGPGRART